MNQTFVECEWYTPRFGGHLCLMKNDIISDTIRHRGEWVGCREHIETWRRHATSENGLVVDVGANIGACTLQFVFQTTATVIAIEPYPKNLYHLRASIARSAKYVPSILKRITVVPLAVGRAVENATQYSALGNSGNSVIGKRVRDHREQDMCSEASIHVDTLDNVLADVERVCFLKADVQGFECNMMKGMRKTAPRITSMTIELANGWLRPQNCSPHKALKLIRNMGFRTDSVPACVYSYFGCDLTVTRERDDGTRRSLSRSV